MFLYFIIDNNNNMSEEFNFLEALKEAINTKKEWFNSTELPRLLESYRLLHTCVRNVYELLIKRD